MIYQLTWKTLPGLKGLACSDFSAVPTAAPDSARGVAFECSSEAECADLVLRLDAHFGAQRFSNNASAFETVKAYVLEWIAQRLHADRARHSAP
jgi:hypothetical protein